MASFSLEVAVSVEQRERWARIIDQYRAGAPMAVIAVNEGVDLKTVHNVARRAGLPRRHRFDADRTARILATYKAGRPVHEIATAEGVHHSYIRAVAKRAGLPPRTEWRRRYPLNEKAFDNPDATGWWLIGLLAADGCVSSSNHGISLCQREADADVLYAFLDHVGCPQRPLVELKLSPEAAARTWSRSRAFEARVSSRRMQRSLAKHGIVPRKTRDLQLSDEARKQPAVWLGLLDGDGWVSETGQRGRPIIDFTGTPTVMEQCSAFWRARLAFRRVDAPRVGAHHGGLGRVKLHGANAAAAARILLAASPISLHRKRRTLEAIAALSSG